MLERIINLLTPTNVLDVLNHILINLNLLNILFSKEDKFPNKRALLIAFLMWFFIDVDHILLTTTRRLFHNIFYFLFLSWIISRAFRLDYVKVLAIISTHALQDIPYGPIYLFYPIYDEPLKFYTLIDVNSLLLEIITLIINVAILLLTKKVFYVSSK